MGLVRRDILHILLLIIFTQPVQSLSQAAEQAGSFSITQSPAETASTEQPVVWTMALTEQGIQNALQVFWQAPAEAAAPGGQLVWSYRVAVDGVIMLQEFPTVSQQQREAVIPLDRLAEGNHRAVLTVRDFSGNQYRQELVFTLDRSPLIRLASHPDESAVFDPELTVSFYGKSDQDSGIIDFYLDKRPFKTITVAQEKNNVPVSLSNLLETPIYRADLSPGNHLLTIAARGMNGGSATDAVIISGSTVLPELKMDYNQDGTFERLGISFPASSKAIVGVVELYHQRSVILARRTTQTTMTITRADIKQAFDNHNLNRTELPASLTLSAKTANQMVTWQIIDLYQDTPGSR